MVPFFVLVVWKREYNTILITGWFLTGDLKKKLLHLKRITNISYSGLWFLTLLGWSRWCLEIMISLIIMRGSMMTKAKLSCVRSICGNFLDFWPFQVAEWLDLNWQTFRLWEGLSLWILLLFKPLSVTFSNILRQATETWHNMVSYWGRKKYPFCLFWCASLLWFNV